MLSKFLVKVDENVIKTGNPFVWKFNLFNIILQCYLYSVQYAV